MSIIVRQLENFDLESNSGFWETLNNLSVSDDTGLLPLADKISAWEKIKNQGAYIYIAFDSDNSQIVGIIKLLIEQKFNRHLSKAGHIEDVVTRRGYEGRGIASNLLRAAIEKAKEESCYKIILDCHEDLKKFYERSGFLQTDICMRLNI